MNAQYFKMVYLLLVVVLCWGWAATGCHAADPDLVGYWNFDEGVGNLAVDWSGMGSTGELFGGATWDPNGKSRGCLYFDGVDDVVEIGDAAWNNAAPVTYIAWYKVDTGCNASAYVLEHQFGGAVPGAFALHTPRRMKASCYGGSATAATVTASPTDLPTGVWMMAAFTITDSTLTLYKDGALIGSAAISGGFPKRAGPLYVGGRGTVGDFYFKGWIDEVAVYKRALSGPDIQAIYNGYQAGTPIATPYDGSVAAGAVIPNKVLYRKGESGTATVVVRNCTATSQNPTVTLASRRWLQTDRTLNTQNPALAAWQTVALTMPFTLSATEEEFGCALRASTNIGANNSQSEFVSVANTLGKVGICGFLHPATYSHQSDALITKEMRNQRKTYANWLEWFFWAPDDWGNMTPTGVSWYSGQARYQIIDSSLQTVIAQAHSHGMQMVTYGKGVGGGPDGWEMTRWKPELYLKNTLGQPYGNWHVEDLDNWNDPAWTPQYSWYWNYPDFRRIDTLDYGLAEITGSTTQYGWDGIRFDGHYTTANDELSTWNIRRLKETVWGSAPTFQFGFNYGFGPDSYPGGMNHEMREGMAGGGMWMQEGLKTFNYTAGQQYTTWTHYAENELAVAKQIQAIGGNYQCTWNLTNSNTSLYKLIYGLIAGGHPVYGGYNTVPGCANWGKFMTRWSMFLWHPRLQPVANPTAEATVSAPALYWQPLMQEVVASTTRKFKVLHLVNPSTSNTISATALPAPVTNVTVTLTAPETVQRAFLVRPENEPYEIELTKTTQGQVTTVTVPQITYWGMVVFELSGSFTVPPPPPAYTEQPDPIEVENGRSAGDLLITDPLEPPAVGLVLQPNEQLWETDRGYNSVPAASTTDPDANNGVAQVRETGVSAAYVGRSYMGHLAPGRYVARFRAKLVDTEGAIDRQSMSWQVYNYNVRTGVSTPVQYVLYDTDPAYVPGHPERVYTVDGQYHEYNLPEFECTETADMTVVANATVLGDNNNRFLLDHIIITQLEKYTDVRLEEWFTPNKPPGLPTPNGGNPATVLEVCGMHWQFYDVAGAVTCTETYSLPETYEALYAYDAVILTDVDLSLTDWWTRRRLKDYVTDGGRLVILGGPFTLGVGGFQGTYLDDMLPFTLEGRTEITQCPSPLLLGGQPWTPYADTPALFWRHYVMPKDGVTVDAYAGNQPIATRKVSGNGSVVAFTGTVQGNGTNAFWGCASWSTLLQQLIQGPPTGTVYARNVYYDVGAGQPYATIQAALNATPFTFNGGNPTGTVTDPFAQNHIIRVHAGTYAAFNTDANSKLNGKASRANPLNRLIIQAAPGEDVTVNATGFSYIRESYVTVQGLKFTGRTGVNDRYLVLNYYSEARGGLLVYNNEFIGAPPLWVRYANTEATQFSYAFVNNYVHNFNANYVVDAANVADAGKCLVAGNLVTFPGSGGTPVVALKCAAGYRNRYVLNNTYFTGTNVIAKQFLRSSGGNQSMLTVANNLLVQDSNATDRDLGYNLDSGGGAGVYITNFPVFRNNLQYDNGVSNHRWARITENGAVQAGDNLSTLVAFNNYVNAVGATPGELNSIDNTDPLLVDPTNANFRLQATSPAKNVGDASWWTTAVNDLGITALLSAYFNTVRDPGFDTGHVNMGAMQAL
ncbi:MAG: LamG domain-containing protein [Armatimonadota bacterium]